LSILIGDAGNSRDLDNFLTNFLIILRSSADFKKVISNRMIEYRFVVSERLPVIGYRKLSNIDKGCEARIRHIVKNCGLRVRMIKSAIKLSSFDTSRTRLHLERVFTWMVVTRLPVCVYAAMSILHAESNGATISGYISLQIIR
jgi:hypothetical protein